MIGKLKIIIIPVIVILLIGICIYNYRGVFSQFTINKSVSIGDIANIMLALETLFIAIYIPFFLNKQINNKRAEKDMIISDCNSQEMELQELRKLINEAYNAKSITRDVANRLIAKTQHISKRLRLLEKTVTTYFSNKEIKTTLKLLNDNQLSCWESLTFNLRDRKPKIGQTNYAQVTDVLYTYSGNLTTLKFCVNRC